MSEQQSLNGDGTITIKTSSWNRVVRERDEARESLKHITEYGTEEINAAVELRQKLATALVERDEAREDLDEEKKFHHRTHAELIQTQCKLLDMQMGRDEAQYESEQQARLLGISAEREYALRGKIFELERKILQLEAK